MTTTHKTAPHPQPRPAAGAPLDVSIVLPCRNEHATITSCITDGAAWIESRHLHGEILVIDNASTDNSAVLAAGAGAHVIYEPTIGYGTALRTGINAARGAVIILADADGTYDLTNLDPYYDPIAITQTADLVIGNRFFDGKPTHMPALNAVGNLVLSRLTRTITKTPAIDIHCGLRALRATLQTPPPWSTGMEYATHMLVHAHHHGARITNTPTTLHAAAPGRTSHLHPLRDGLRHLATIARAQFERPPRQLG